MTRAIIRWSAENRWVVLLAAAAVVLFAVYTLRHDPGRRDPRPLRHAGHRLLALGPEPRHHRGPGHLSDRDRPPRRAEACKTIRGFSDFGFSYVYVIFEDGTDIYWARSRVLEYLSKIQPRLPEGVRTELGPDATGVGWVFQYALVDETGRTLARRAAHLPGLDAALSRCSPCRASPRSRASAASQKQYQVTVDPNRLAAYGLALDGGRRRDPREQQRRRRRACSSWPAASTWCAAAATSTLGRGHRADRRARDRRQGTPVLLRDVAAGRARPRDPARRRRPRRPAATRSAASSSCATARTRCDVIDARQERLRGDRAVAARGREDRHDLRPLGADRARDRHAAARASCWRW